MSNKKRLVILILIILYFIAAYIAYKVFDGDRNSTENVVLYAQTTITPQLSTTLTGIEKSYTAANGNSADVIQLTTEIPIATTTLIDISPIAYEIASETTTIQVQTTTIQPTTLIDTTTEATTVQNYSDEDLYWLSRVIDAEASDCCTDEHKLWVGTVVMNRVDSSQFPNTVKGVITQTGQYETYINGTIYNYPSRRSIDAAIKLLNGYRPPNSQGCIWQANFIQGQVVRTFQTSFSTTYICR
jgi:hypothetical protein